MSHSSNKLTKFTVLAAVLAASAFGASSVASADQGGVAHGTKPCPRQSNSGEHKGAGHRKKHGANKGRKCGRPPQTAMTPAPSGQQNTGANHEDKPADRSDKPKDNDQPESDETDQTHKPHSGSGIKTDHGHHEHAG